jgi:Pyridoxamine 5'-phosphate oxidase
MALCYRDRVARCAAGDVIVGAIATEIEPGLARWIEAQPVFFVATAPRADSGHINLSPKGADTLRVIGPRHLVYLDMPGSGAETVAHLRENGRIVLMLCAFSGAPKILRLHGQGRPVFPGDAEFAGLQMRFPVQPAVRCLIVVEVKRVADSCGFAVPLLEKKADRTELAEWVAGSTDERLREYGVRKNQRSIDDLAALTPAESRQVIINR